MIPTTDADRLLKTPTINSATKSVTGIGNVAFLTVPLGDRWAIGFMRAARASGTMTYNRFAVTDPAGANMLVADFTSEANTHLHEFQQPLIVDEGWTVDVNFNAHSVTGNVEVTIMYEREDAF